MTAFCTFILQQGTIGMYIIYIYLTSLSTSRTLFRNACAWLKEYWQVNDQKVEMEELWDEKNTALIENGRTCSYGRSTGGF